MPVLGNLDYLAHLRADSARFVEVLVGADPALRVPPCPDWTVPDLLWHLAEVQLFWAVIVEGRLSDPAAAEQAKPPRPEGLAELAEVFRTSSDRLQRALAATPPETELWTWFRDDQSASFARRRQAHEAVIHRLDAELTTGELTDIDPALATDGVAEVFDWMYSEIPPWATAGTGGPLGRIRTRDTGAEWLVQVGSWSGTSPRSGKTYTDEGSLAIVADGDPTFSVAGTARDLDAWLWNRPPLGEIELDGDHARFVEIVREGVQ